LFLSLIASSDVDDLEHTRVDMCKCDYVTVMEILVVVITELFTHRDVKINYENRFVKTKLCMVFYQLCYV
jgi:hypothetical protein